MLAGQRVPAGLSYATVLPDFDFEAYSEAGYYFCPEAKRFKGLTKTGPGLAAVGAAVYSEHPSTEIISLAYDLKDSKGPRLWIPSMAPPVELFAYLRAGGLIEAWYSGFEYLLWKNVCEARYGWPRLPLDQLRCAMAKGKAFGLPGKLEKAAEVTCADVQKDKRGKALIRLLCIPQKPTKKQPNTRNQDPALLGEMYSYNIDDIRSEAAVSSLTPDLSPEELEIWLLDQRINQRGVHIDKKALDNCIAIVEQAKERYTAELIDITSGEVQSVGELAKIIRWLASRGVHMASLDSEAVEAGIARLKKSGKTPQCLRVLEIRALLGAASVKKLGAIDRALPRDSRLKDLFAYCGADRTGRWAGRGAQPQNLTNSGPDIWCCASCGTIRWEGLAKCWQCGGLRTDGDHANWGIEAVEVALIDIATRNLDWVESQWGDAIAVVSGCLRGLFSAAPGHDLICSDFSAIEAVVLAFMAEEEWRMEVFRTHGKIYEASASTMSGVPLDEILRYKKDTGNHHELRKKGKVNELACFGADTQVLTDRGPKRIADVSPRDLLHDGVEFVRQSGVIFRGERLTLKMGGVTVTQEHKFLTGENKWETAEDLNESTRLLKLAIDTAISVSCGRLEGIQAGSSGTSANAPAAMSGCTSQATYDSAKLAGANPVVSKNPEKQLPSTGQPAQIRGTVKGFLTGYLLRFRDVLTRTTASTPSTEVVGSTSARNGSMTAKSGSTISAPCQTGTSLRQQSTGSKTTKGTSRGTSDSFLTASSKTIREALFGLITAVRKCLCPSFTSGSARSMLSPARSEGSSKAGSAPMRSLSTRAGVGGNTKRVYDILNCGPRSRFVILSSQGPLIAHNCGYGGGVGAAKAFGADKLGLSDDDIQANVKSWRAASPAIAGYGNKGVSMGLPPSPNRPGYPDQKLGFWYGIQGAAYKAIRNPGQCFSFKRMTYGMHAGNLYAKLPSGRYLVYHDAKLEQGFTPWGAETTRMTYVGWNTNYLNGPTGWMKMETYGPKLVENLVQGIARDILAFAMVNIEAADYPIVLHIHDEIVSEVPKGFGSVEEFEKIMATMPPWCADWPIKAAGGWRGLRYRKD